MHQAPKTALTRWIVFGTLCGLIAVACLFQRFPVLPL
jgi:hypothetical protein